MATGDKLILSVATVFLYYNRGASVQGWSSATFWGLGSGQMGPYKGRAYASTVPRYGRCVEPGDSFSSLDFLHGWWSEMPIPPKRAKQWKRLSAERRRSWMRGPPNLSCPHGARHSRACQTLMARQRDALSELELDLQQPGTRYPALRATKEIGRKRSLKSWYNS